MPPDYWTEFQRCEGAIRLVARKLGDRARPYISFGREDLGELEIEALIGEVFQRLYDGRSAWQEDRCSFQTFFCQQIQNRIQALKQKSRQLHIRVASSDEGTPDCPSLHYLIQTPASEDLFFDDTLGSRFIRFLEKSHPKLAPVTRLHLAGQSEQQIMTALNMKSRTVQRRLNGMREIARRYRDDFDTKG